MAKIYTDEIGFYQNYLMTVIYPDNKELNYRMYFM